VPIRRTWNHNPLRGRPGDEGSWNTLAPGRGAPFQLAKHAASPQGPTGCHIIMPNAQFLCVAVSHQPRASADIRCSSAAPTPRTIVQFVDKRLLAGHRPMSCPEKPFSRETRKGFVIQKGPRQPWALHKVKCRRWARGHPLPQTAEAGASRSFLYAGVMTELGHPSAEPPPR